MAARPAGPVYDVGREQDHAARGGLQGVDRDVIETDAVEARLRNRGLDPRWQGTPPAAFSGLALDSRGVRPGHLFCAIAGLRHDGHDFVDAAGRAGAAAAVVERDPADLEPDRPGARTPGPGASGPETLGAEAPGAETSAPGTPLPLLRVSDTRLAAAHLASLFHGDPAVGLRLVGVTGTNGKTTTVWILRHLLGALGPAGALGTLGRVSPAGELQPGELTTPDPVGLARALAALREEGAESVAMEVSSHALDQRRPDALRFRAAVFTNLSREHLDYHPDMEAYREAKLRLVELVDPDGVCVVNADEPAWSAVPERARERGLRVVTIGLAAEEDGSSCDSPSGSFSRSPSDPAPDMRAADLRHGPAGSRWRLECAAGTAEVRLPLPGEFNVHNALAAAAVALDVGLRPAAVAAALGSVPPVPGRMEILRREPSLVLRDYAHTPDAFERVLGSLRRRTAGRLLLVFGPGGDRDPGKRPIMGRIASELCDRTFLTTDNPRSEDPAEIARQTAVAMEPERYAVELDRERAIARALEEAGPDDLVVLLGKGHETYQVVNGEKLPFDEREIVARLTAEGGAP